MTAPSTTPEKKILIARFPSHDGAEGAIGRLKAAGVRLGNVAHIEKNDAGEIKFAESQDWGIGKSAVVGAIAAIILPGIGPIVGAAVGALAAYLIDVGFPDELLKQTGSGVLQPGQSALVALVQGDDSAMAETSINEGGGTVLASGAESELARTLDSARGASPA